MANTLKLRGGTTAEVAAATLAEREIMVDTTKDVIVVGPTKKEMAVANGGTYTGNYTFSGDVIINGAATFGSSLNANSLRIQNVATPTGNSDATNKSYVDGQITSVQNTTLPGNVFSADGSVTITDNNPGVGDIDLAVTPASVTTAKLADDSVTTAKIVDNNVTGAKFANNSITTAKLQDQAVTSAKLAVSAVTSNRIDAGAVGTTKLANSSVTAIKLATDSVVTDKIQDDAVTAAKINGLTATITELNQVDAKTLVPGTVTWSSTTQLPSAAQINSRIAATVDAVGGFVAIPDETSFPASHPDPNEDAGTVISIADAGGLVIGATGQGVGVRTGGGVVLINGFPASMHSTTLADGLGLQVQTTGTAHVYTYHKLIAKEDDILQLSDDINDFNNRYRIGAADPTSDNDEGDLFYNTSDNVLKIHDGTNFSVAAAGTAANVANTAAGNLTSTNVQDSLQELQGDIDTNTGNLNALTTLVTLQGAQVTLNQTGVLNNATNIATNATDIATNATDIASNTTTIGTLMPLTGGTFTGNVSLSSQIGLQFKESTPNGNNFVAFKSPTTIASNVTWTLPAADGLAGQALVTDASGNLSWAAAGGASGAGTNLWALEHDNTISGSYTIGAGKNVVSAGPLTVNSGVTVTVPAGSNWVIV